MTIVYRSTHPDVVVHMERYREAYAAWQDNVRAALVGLGFTADHRIWLSDRAVIGVIHPHGLPIPDGWRRDRKADEPVIVPARRTTLGRTHGVILDSLNRPDPRLSLPGGMPRRAMAKAEMSFLGCGLERVDGAVYVTWSAELRDGDADRIDPTVWERIKLSEYYAALESAEAVSS